MISSRVIKYMHPYFEIISNSIGKTIGQIKDELGIERKKMVKGASGLIVENLLGIKNNNKDEPDIPEIGCEVKCLPLQKKKLSEAASKEYENRRQAGISLCCPGTFHIHYAGQ